MCRPPSLGPAQVPPPRGPLAGGHTPAGGSGPGPPPEPPRILGLSSQSAYCVPGLSVRVWPSEEGSLAPSQPQSGGSRVCIRPLGCPAVMGRRPPGRALASLPSSRQAGALPQAPVHLAVGAPQTRRAFQRPPAQQAVSGQPGPPRARHPIHDGLAAALFMNQEAEVRVIPPATVAGSQGAQPGQRRGPLVTSWAARVAGHAQRCIPAREVSDIPQTHGPMALGHIWDAPMLTHGWTGS